MWTPIQSLRFALGATAAVAALAMASGPTYAQEAAPAIETKPEPPAVVAPTPRVPEQVDPTLADRIRTATVVVRPGYTRQPAPEFPDRAIVNGISEGAVTLKCVAETTSFVSGCEVLHETPANMGFGQAALYSTRRARIRPMTVDGVPEASFIQFTIRFSLPIEPPRLAVVEDPQWARAPRVQMPREARRARIERAQVVLDCEIASLTTGRLRACVVKQEEPTGHGFGRAALEAVRDAAIAPAELYEAASDAHAVFTVHFER